MTTAERRRVTAMYGSILGLHLVGFTIFAAFVIPAHYRGLGIGVSVLAYTLGLRHAFDADHIAVIDNTTRKELGARNGTGKPRPLCFGYFFSLGHSSVVVAVGVAIVVAEKVVFGQLVNGNVAGFVIVGLFLATWAIALLIWRYGHRGEMASAMVSDGFPA